MLNGTSIFFVFIKLFPLREPTSASLNLNDSELKTPLLTLKSALSAGTVNCHKITDVSE